MIKKGTSIILLCLYYIASFAQDGMYDQNGLPAHSNNSWSISLWVIIPAVLIIGALLFFVGVYVNKKTEKAKRLTVVQSPSQPQSYPQPLPPERLSQPQQPNTNTFFPNPYTNSDTPAYSSEASLAPSPQQPSFPLTESEETFATPGEGIERHQILIIEDHKDIRLYLKILLNKDYDLLIAENGEEGLKLARKKLPDLIITDIMMPLMDGFECCKRIKEDLKTCHIPIILLTALMGDENIVKGIELGADDYIVKPFNPKILRTKVKQLIKSRQELKHLYSKLFTPAAAMEPQEIEEENIVKKTEDPFIAQIVQIVENNLQNPTFSVKKLSEMLNMSQPTLYRRVKLLTNFTIIELVRGVRLKRSAELLKSRQHNVQEVAEMVGYNDIPTFRRHFIDFYGTTPSTFWRDEN